MLRLVMTLSQLIVLSRSLLASCKTRLRLFLVGLHLHVGPKAITWVYVHHFPHCFFTIPAASLD